MCAATIACEADPTPIESVSDASIIQPGDASRDGPLVERFDAGPEEVDAGDTPPPVRALNSILPGRGPLTGGGRIRIVGQGFIDDVSVTIAGQPCSEVELESENHLRCTIPEGRAIGAANVVVRWPDTHRREVLKAFTYFQSLTVPTPRPTTSTPVAT